MPRRIALVGIASPLREALRTRLAPTAELVELPERPATSAALATADPCSHVVLGAPHGELAAAVDDAGLGTWRTLELLRPHVVVQLSSMALMEPYDPGWAVVETWATQPREASLACHLAELVTREVSRMRSLRTVVLRLDPIVAGAEPGPDQLPADDAASAIERALTDADHGRNAWRVYHVVGGQGRFPLSAAQREPLNWRPSHAPKNVAVPSGPPTYPQPAQALTGLTEPRRVTVFGAGGPLGVATVAAFHEAAPGVPLRLTDARPLDVIRRLPPQSSGAPRPTQVTPPDEETVVDITDADAVLDAATGADALVNCSVVRTGSEAAFRVNVSGALNVMRAARHLGIRRVVHTGPAMGLLPHPWGHLEDGNVGAAAPDRAGDNLYFLSKLLGREVVRVLAAEYAIAAPALLYNQLIDPSLAMPAEMTSFAISWRDAGGCVVAAARVAQLPEASPTVLVMAPSPHGRYDRSSADVLGWEPRDRLDAAWTRRG